ncbi:ABC transporter substrate-binding protein [Sulfurimonas sp.]
MKKLLLLFLPIFLFASMQKISVQLEWKHQFEFAGFYAAIEQGYYKDIGLDVELKEFEDGINISDNVINGHSTFGVSSSSLILDKLQNKPVVLVASYFKQNALALVTSSNIKSIKDLKNKKIMALDYEIDHTSIGVLLKDNKLNKNDYKLVKHDYSIDKFVNGEVDAMSIFITNQPYLLDEKNIDYNILNPSDYGIYSYDLELFTSKKFVNSNPELVKKFAEATNKGWEYAFKNKNKVIDLIYNKYSSKKSKKALFYEAMQTQKLFKTNIFKIGSIVPELIELNTRMYIKLDLLNKDVNMKNLLSDYIFESKKSIQLTNQEEMFLNQNKTIKIANQMDWAPFDYNEFGKAKGMSIDYVKYIFEELNLNYEFISGYTWSELLKLYQDKKIDVMPAYYKNKDREEQSLFTTPYYEANLAIFSLPENKNIKSTQDLIGKKVGIEKGDGSIPIIKEYLKDSKIVEVSRFIKLINMLKEKKIDAVVFNTLRFEHYAKNMKLLNINLIDYIDLTQEQQRKISLHIGVRKELKPLHSILQKKINSLNEDKIVTLKSRWLTKDSNNKINLTDEEKRYLLHKKITMCIDPQWMPFESFKNGKYIGLNADLFDIFQKNIGKHIEIIETKTWDESLKLAKNRDCDILSLLMETPERKKYLNITKGYLSIPMVLATKPEVSFITDIHMLEGVSVGITKGYSFGEILRSKYPKLNIVDVENIEDGLEQVRDGKLFGYIGTLATIGYKFQTKFMGELKIAGKFDGSWELGIGVRNDDHTLTSIMQKAVDSIDENTKKEIFNKWVAIKYEKGTDYTLIWKILFIATLLLLGVIYWNRKLSQLNKQLSLAKDKAGEATREKANFLANMSHEIRTPMNSIIGMSYLIKETKLNKTQFDYVKKIEISSNNLLKLINDILDFSKIEARRLELKKVDFNLLEIINNVENMLKLEAFEKGLEFNIVYDKSKSMQLYGDSLRLSQILINLVSNAIKFTHNGKVELIVKKLDDENYRFEIVDTGIGLTEIQKQDIFSSFTQADDSITRKYGGTGLGLAIAKELVQLMDGKIWVESTYGQGSKFTFEINLATSKKDIDKKDLILDSKDSYTKDATDKVFLNEEEAKKLFSKLLEATKKRRPQQCEPILKEFENYTLDEKSQELYKNVNNLIKRYKFDEARELLDEE